MCMNICIYLEGGSLKMLTNSLLVLLLRGKGVGLTGLIKYSGSDIRTFVVTSSRLISIASIEDSWQIISGYHSHRVRHLTTLVPPCWRGSVKAHWLVFGLLPRLQTYEWNYFRSFRPAHLLAEYHQVNSSIITWNKSVLPKFLAHRVMRYNKVERIRHYVWCSLLHNSR